MLKWESERKIPDFWGCQNEGSISKIHRETQLTLPTDFWSKFYSADQEDQDKPWDQEQPWTWWREGPGVNTPSCSVKLLLTPSWILLPPCPISPPPPPPTLRHWLLFCLQLASFAAKIKDANRCFWHEKFSRPPLPQSNCFPHCDQPGSSESKLLPLATPYTIFKLFWSCYTSILK